MGTSLGPVLRVLAGERLSTPPLWMMRQAGRYLPEYRELRARAGSFLDLCYSPELAAEATLQPIRRFGFDAAILFSDILIIPHALGLEVGFHEGEGPRVETITSPGELGRLKDRLDPVRVGKVYEAVAVVKAGLPRETALIGFVGGPWTVATYIVAGGTSRDHIEARLWASRDPDGFQLLIDRLVAASVEHLSGQIAAGAEAVQIFDSWAGELSTAEFRRWCLEPMRRIVDGVRAQYPDFPIIVFPRGAGSKLRLAGAALSDVALGLDTAEDPLEANRVLPPGQAVQGNLDPLLLIAGGAALDRGVEDVLTGFADRPHIFNLGHGIRPETPIAHVERLVERVRAGAGD